MLGELRLDTMKIHLYDSLLQGHYYNLLEEQGHIQKFKTDVVALLDSIKYWNKRGIPRREVDLEFIIEAWVPQQSGPLGDCAVWSCLLLEYAISGVRVPVQGDANYMTTDYMARVFRERMGRIFWGFPFMLLLDGVCENNL
ncbi:hypothetical protein L2E82_49586 [Cichorium intybus]|uniref:Uncharacterized protein n=1 Tax=Cichorium intybus TaxID=13427 RepID=A0ACB8Z0I2_CICIN|nr:hypothetical protein L2E82_49586 [Cichorium intybus]